VFTEGAVLPGKYVCTNDTAQGGTNVSPPLSWTAGPSGTMSYAIVMRDLDFMNGFVHWVIWDIPANVTSLPEDVEHADQPSAPAGAKQADFNGSVTGYYGPCSPSNVNTYEFTLYAMPNATTSGPVAGGDKNAAASSIESQAIGSTTLSTES
jgi:Raf kinase inhibitor-like YbhB/YbcL family protein